MRRYEPGDKTGVHTADIHPGVERLATRFLPAIPIFAGA
jgi:hypothetical protein